MNQQITWWRLLIAILLVSVGVETAMAVPALRRPITITQKDGTTLTILKFGDEFVNWTTTTDGYDIVQTNGIYHYATVTPDGKRQSTQQKVSNLILRNATERAFLGKMQKSQMARYSVPLAQTTRATRAAAEIQRAPFPNKGAIRSIVILAQYQDVKFSVLSPKNAFNNQLNKPGYSVEGAVGSAKEYFTVNSGGQMVPEFDVVGPVTLSKPMAYYGGNDDNGYDLRPQEMISEACALAAAAGVNFSQYDYNNDGVIDNVFVYYAGHNEAEGGAAESIWPHRSVVSSRPVFNGKTLEGYACTSELRGAQGIKIAGVGTFCHEFGHVFGLVDFYDTDYFANGYSYGMSDYDVMSSGSYNREGNAPPLYNGIELMTVGWVKEQTLDLSNLGTKELKPIQNRQVYRVDTDIQGEYFLIENRQKGSSVWESGIPGSGLMITHIDKSAQYINRWAENRPNYDPNHECAKFVYANIDRPTDSGWDLVPFNGESGNNSWGRNTEKRAQGWSGNYVGFDVTDITKDGETITFRTVVPGLANLTGKVRATSSTAIEGAEITLVKNQGPSRASASMARSMTKANVSIPGTLYTTTSDAQGNFDIQGISDGNYVLLVNKTGYVPYAGNVSINKAENQLNVTLSTTVESEFTKVTYQTGRYHNNLSAGGESFGLYVKHTAASLRKYIGTSIRQVRVFSPNTTDMQLRIYNNTDEEPIYTRDVTVTEEMTNSYTTLDFNEGEIVIEPGKDYYIGFDYANYSDMGTGAFDDDTSLTYEGIANILTLGNQWGSAFWGTGQAERGNYMLDVFFGAESIVEKPTSVTMQATAEVNLNYTTQLTALFAPATASQFASWNSSDVDVARVNENGVVTALGEGTTTITAVSIFNPAVLSRCVVTVTAPRSATLTGRVLDQAGQPVVGAKITFAKRAASNAPAGVINNLLNQASPMPLLARSAAKVEDQPLRTASYAQGTVITTDQSGAYTITGLEAMASYTLNVAPNTNLLLSGSVNVAPLAAGTSTLDLILNPNPTLTMSELKYHNNQPSYGVGMGSASMNFIIAIDSTTYGNNGGKLLSHVELNIGELYQDNTAVSISIFHERDIHHALQGAFWRVYQPGKIMINLADLGMTIPKDEKIYLNIIVTGTLMMDKSTPAVEGYGNLYFNEKTNAIEPITKRGDYPGNWAVSTYMVDKDPVLVDWIDISSKTGTSDLPVGRTMALDADVQPWSSDYRHVNWRSMDESVATVDKNGVVTGVGEGSTWIVAKAKDSRGAQGGFEVNVQNRQAAEGVVKTTEGQPAAGAQMTFTLVEPMSQSYGKLSLHSYSKILTKSDPITTTVGEDGKYSVNIPEGQYELSIQKEGCVELKQVVTIATGLNDKMDYTLMTAFQLNSTQLTYCNNWLNNAVSNGGGEFTVAARWTKEDLKQHVGSNITRLRYATLAAGAHIELVVLANGDLSRPLLKIDVPSTAAGWSSLDLTPAQYVKIPADTEISFGYTIVMHDPNSNVAGIDMEQAIDGKGNLIYVEGAWHNVSEFSIGGNWQLGMYVQTADQVDGIDLRVGQEKVSLSWGAATYTSYQVSYAQVGAELGEAVKVDKPSYTFTNLLPGKSYTYRIDGSNDGDYFVPMFTKQFTTKARVTDIPAINIDVYEVIEGTPIRLDVLNTLAGDAIVWKIDGQVVTTSEVTLGVGTHEIRTEIKRAGTTYVTKRRVVVKAN